ncbi:MAG: branched-chain amino acid aminotransferase [Kiritimatiellia bacterium]|jgi:branched-chain amino acid aminotransferase
MKIFLNGKLVPEEKAVVSVFDHGLLYGDGVFEGIRAYFGRVFLLEEHVDRLYDSAKAIDLKINMSKAAMMQAVVDTCKANKITDGYIRLVITRGVGTLGLNPYTCKTPQVIIIAATIQLYPEKLYKDGMKVVTVGTIRNHPEAINPRIKSLNYLNNVLAKIEAINSGVLECIMMNHNGYVAEASGDNIFVVKDKRLLTPSVSSGILEGLTRNFVMELAREAGYAVEEVSMSRYDLFTADELFLTGTAAEIIAVVDVDHRKIGKGKPGKVTRELANMFTERTKVTGTLIT